MRTHPVDRAIVGATVIDGTGSAPIPDAVVVITGDRIRSVAPATETAVPEHAEVIDARGKYVIPGLLDANVHLFAGLTLDLMIDHEGAFADLVEEAAQITLKAGVTTVFDTWGPLEPLIDVRDRINRGDVVGSRMFVAGNIIGLGGPLSPDFRPVGDVLAPSAIDRFNRHWEQGVGGDLLWRTPDEVRRRVRHYIERSGVDFIKYAASGHGFGQMQFITFSPETQRAIVEEGHRAGLTVQAHTTTVASLRMEIEAGADLLQHGDVTGPQPIPDDTLSLIVDRGLPVAALIATERYLAWLSTSGRRQLLDLYTGTDINDRRLIAAGAKLLLTTDGFAYGPRVTGHPQFARSAVGAVDFPTQLGESHISWLRGAIERGMAPMDVLLTATRNIAEAYRVADELGTLEAGKKADLLVLDGDPLADVDNYARIAAVFKDGAAVDRDKLPVRRVITEPAAALAGAR